MLEASDSRGNMPSEGGFKTEMTTFFTSDHHFGHANILKYEDAMRRNASGERFQSVEEMDEHLIEQWNATVSLGDTVYHLGDLSYKLNTMEEILPQLNGSIILIAGNHDPFFKSMHGDPEQQTAAREHALQIGFAELYIQHAITIEGIGLVQLSHFPYRPHEGAPEHDQRYLELRPKPGEETALLHGHVHSQWIDHTYPGLPPMLNVGVEMWKMRPVSEAQIVEQFKRVLETAYLMRSPKNAKRLMESIEQLAVQGGHQRAPAD